MDMQIGDLVTFVNRIDGTSFIDIMTRETFGNYYRLYFKGVLEILKIERPHYKEIKQASVTDKELLTPKEKEFIKDMIKYYDIDEIEVTEGYINFFEKSLLVSCSFIPIDLNFINIKRHKKYKIQKLGLEKK